MKHSVATRSEARGAAPPAGHVLIVDDDDDARGAMDSLFRSIGLSTSGFQSAQGLLAAAVPDGACCLVIDVLLPGLGGLELPARLAERGITVPFIFVTGYGDVPMTVRAMKAGAIDVLEKPVRGQDLIDAVTDGLALHRRRLDAAEATAALRAAFATLTPREREVLELVVRGMMNKQIAAELGLSEVTVKMHRGTMAKKLGTRSVVELAGMAAAVGTDP